MKYISKVLYIIVLIIGIILGIVIRSWVGIDWSKLDYGSIADWVSGIGTIAAILGSAIFFKLDNTSKIEARIIPRGLGITTSSYMDIRFINNGRRTGNFQYWMLQYKNDYQSVRAKNLGLEEQIKNPLDSEMLEPESLGPGEASRLFQFDLKRIVCELTDEYEIKEFSGTGAILDKIFNLVIFDGNKSRKIPIRVCYELRVLNEQKDDVSIDINDVEVV